MRTSCSSISTFLTNARTISRRVVPVRLLQSLGDPPRELLQLADHQPQFRLPVLLAGPPLALVLQLGEALPRRRDPRLEFRLLQQAVP